MRQNGNETEQRLYLPRFAILSRSICIEANSHIPFFIPDSTNDPNRSSRSIWDDISLSTLCPTKISNCQWKWIRERFSLWRFVSVLIDGDIVSWPFMFASNLAMSSRCREKLSAIVLVASSADVITFFTSIGETGIMKLNSELNRLMQSNWEGRGGNARIREPIFRGKSISSFLLTFF